MVVQFQRFLNGTDGVDETSVAHAAVLCGDGKIMLLEAFSPHDLLTAYIKNTLAGYPRLEDQNLDDLTVELLYPTDEAAEHCIKEFLALRLDDDNEHELEQ